MNTKSTRQRLLGSSVLVAAAFAVLAPAGGALAQTANPPTDSSATAQSQEVVVTGSILHRRNADSDSPLTIQTAADLDARGITTVQNAVQNLSGNNSGALPNSFSANGAFAAGASGASLRGLTTNSTLVLVDGLRMTYYPIADDGVRNFVDLNTIPDVIVDRVEVLQDGASATYGADAIAGVINVITKKTFQGFQAKIEGGGATEHSGGGTFHIDGIFGRGDLGADGYNVYLAAEYQKDDALYSRQLGYPYNTSNQSRICQPGNPTNCGFNNIANGFNADGSWNGLQTTTVPVFRPYDATGATALGPYQVGPSGCGKLPTANITAANSPSPAAYLGAYCQEDFQNQYGVVEPEDTRLSINFHAIKNIGATNQAYFEANFYQNEVQYQTSPVYQNIENTTPPYGSFPRYSTSNPSLKLPIYVCPTGSPTYTCSAADAGAVLNPNNPYAGLGETARVLYDFGDIPAGEDIISQVFRFATGINGTFGSDWKYSVDLTGSQSDLQTTSYGNIYVANLLTAVNQGTYNFVNPSANTSAIRNFIAPPNVQNSDSKLLQLQANISKSLFQLPGGTAQLGMGVAARYESLYDPSANPQVAGQPAYDRYFTINPFFSVGQRSVYSWDGELDLPVFKQLDIDLAARYDKYSTGQDNISPKIGIKFKPIQMLTFRGTYSTGFRIPSFAEEFGQVTGYVPVTGTLFPGCVALHPANSGNYCNYSIGETQIGNAGLAPETSSNITAGFVFEPFRQFSFSADYYRIKKNHVIAAPDIGPAVNAYYATGNGNAVPGFTVTPGNPDINAPGALPNAAFVTYSAENENRVFTDGFDFNATTRWVLPWRQTKFTSSFQGTYVKTYDLTLGDGSTESFVGTLGPFNTTSGSGTPRFRFNWQNTLDFGRVTLTMTVYYTSGYKTEGEDITGPGTRGDCGYSLSATYLDGTPIRCYVPSFTDTQLHATFQATKHIQLYVDVDNLFDRPAPFDPATYGGYDYNPAWANSGIMGRYVKVGAKATF